jgi:hypothetical protein
LLNHPAPPSEHKPALNLTSLRRHPRIDLLTPSRKRFQRENLLPALLSHHVVYVGDVPDGFGKLWLKATELLRHGIDNFGSRDGGRNQRIKLRAEFEDLGEGGLCVKKTASVA